MKLQLEIVVGSEPLQNRRCKCGSTDFREIISPKSSYQDAGLDRRNVANEFNMKKLDGYFAGLAICLDCKRIYALI